MGDIWAVAVPLAEVVDVCLVSITALDQFRPCKYKRTCFTIDQFDDASGAIVVFSRYTKAVLDGCSSHGTNREQGSAGG